MTLADVAVMVTVAAPAVVETVNDAEVEPAGTVTVFGTVALPVLLDDSVIVTSTSTANVSVTVPVAEVPPVTGLGETVNVLMPTKTTVVVKESAPTVAVTGRPVVGVDDVLTLKVVEVCPAGTVTDVGGASQSQPWLYERLTTTPPGPAGAFRTIVPWRV